METLLPVIFGLLIIYPALVFARRLFTIETAGEVVAFAVSLIIYALLPSFVTLMLPLVTGGYLLFLVIRSRSLLRRPEPILEHAKDPDGLVEMLLAFLGQSSDGFGKNWVSVLNYFEIRGWNDYAERVRTTGEMAIRQILERLVSIDPPIGNLLYYGYNAQQSDIPNVIENARIVLQGRLYPQIFRRVMMGSFVGLLLSVFISLAIFIAFKLPF
ncbi:MAG: hypothetical protein QW734_06025 [Candidatus Bathyarchaeia archaeon]